MEKSFYLVAGLGKTGYSIARYLSSRQKPFIAFDTRQKFEGATQFKESFPEVSLYLGELPFNCYEQLQGIILSPGLSLEEPFLKRASDLGIPIWGDIECFAQEVKAPVIAITGTNGKSTVTSLVGEMAKAAGFSVAVGGNIGEPVLDLLNDHQTYDLWVLELSSFQLDLTTSLRPSAATILNISSDHLDRHHTIQNYINAKQIIYRNAKNLLFNREDQFTLPQVTHAATASFGLNNPSKREEWGIINQGLTTGLARGDHIFLPTDALNIKGKHNWQNALAASALASAVGIDLSIITDVLKSFKGLPHRCEWVRTLDQVHWINDSKGTNIGATISALFGIGDSMSGKIVLIAGGQGKGADFVELRKSVKDYVRSLVLIGEDAKQIEKALTGSVPISHASSLDEAVLIARQGAKSGDVVLLSPACASFDMFDNFVHRGQVFTDLVTQL